ncbi:hypothetical protein ACOMHN_013876 [Nucella lapillus]
MKSSGIIPHSVEQCVPPVWSSVSHLYGAVCPLCVEQCVPPVWSGVSLLCGEVCPTFAFRTVRSLGSLHFKLYNEQCKAERTHSQSIIAHHAHTTPTSTPTPHPHQDPHNAHIKTHTISSTSKHTTRAESSKLLHITTQRKHSFQHKMSTHLK